MALIFKGLFKNEEWNFRGIYGKEALISSTVLSHFVVIVQHTKPCYLENSASSRLKL